MGGLIALFVVAVWIAVAAWLAKIIARRIAVQRWRTPVGLLAFAVLLALPAIDEIVGGRQFETLCHEHASTIEVNRETAKGRTVYLAVASDEEVKGTWVRVVKKHWRYVDAMTGETVVSYNTLTARGGRLLKVSEGHAPLTFHGYCAPENPPASVETFKEFGINYIQPPRTGEWK